MSKKPTYKELEQRVRELEGIIESMGDGVCIIDAEFRIIYENKVHRDVFGKHVGEYCNVAYYNRDRICDGCPAVLASRSGQVRTMERMVQKEEGATYYEVTASPLRDSSGSITAVIESVRDITERKRADEVLSAEKEKFEILVEESPIGVSLIGEDDQYKYVNPKFVEMFGYTLEDIHSGRKWIAMAYPDAGLRDQIISTWIADIKDSKVSEARHRVFTVTCKDGSEKEIHFRAVTMPNRDQLVICEDITEQKWLERQLHHAQKMESIDTLTSGVAHNFRNILTPISLYSEFILMMYKDDPKLKEMAEKTGECVTKGTQLVDELMQFSRKHAKEIETIDLSKVIRETYDLITKSFDKKIEIRMNIADSLRIRGDRLGLNQVFMNLCTNARDAMPHGGELSIEARMEGDDALVAISDTGLGMDEQTRRQCFDPFFTTKETDNGTGLGLSTTYGIVKDHGGEIHVFSELNKGTTFKLCFPLALSDEHQRQAGAHEIVKGSGEKVLIVDDELDILEVMVLLAERLGYSAASADSGKAGLDKYKSWRPDVVLLDRNMPGMDGLKCARSILEYDPEARIVLISGYDEGGPHGIDDETKALIQGYLTKPMNMEEISQTIRKVLDKD